MLPDVSKNYVDVINGLKQKIHSTRLQTVIAVNAQMLAIYWEIGNTILAQQKADGWGTKIIKRLSNDLKLEFPDMKGLSERNLVYMQTFASNYPYFSITQEALAQNEPSTENRDSIITQAILAKLTWYHHITLLDKVKDAEEKLFYIKETIQNGWSRDLMVHQIESGLFHRRGKITNNFNQTVLPEQSELVTQIFKDPYKFDFIYLGREAKERDLEDALTTQLMKFLLELGQWFSFMGRQYKIQLGEKEYFFDLLFYHTRLKRYVVIDLKINEFKPEYKGKMEFYLNLADEQLKSDGDEPSIGLILCKTKDGLVAEYALRDSNKPIGIAEYKLNEALPENFKGDLPSIEELEAEIERSYEEAKTPSQKKFDALKERLASINTGEIKDGLTLPVLQNLFQKTLSPFFDLLLNRLHAFDSYFYSQEHSWQGLLTCISNPENLIQSWKNEDIVNSYHNPRFNYNLIGFLKNGVDTFNVILQLTFNITPFWFGITIEGYNNQLPLLKKLYHDGLSQQEMQHVCDVAVEYLTEEINRRIS